MKSIATAYHLSIAVSDTKKSYAFYDAFFKQVGWRRHEDGGVVGYSDGQFTLWVGPAKKKGKYVFRTSGFHHFSLRVSKKSDVDALYEWCVEQKVKIIDAPKKYPEYSARYYALFFLDPDGMKIEVTYR